ncbi:chemotaxis response regulator protein-glutamate methylesterase [Bdellovibrio sp. SKB1291214]|uniref:protein-glutamate methylesterase/protein-glutamine glutaminase n=1 Tax=Bdellovibrio sp. SKB1291214 TaxID=1732569 RepID=UPI000B51CC55|nr:chemotaxis response regulator protein-glutamate methylesterase [Bdellovibrio sp. SKB1291214]UYL08690.1 chemotaxis response regulator protein-glutamate methylesterase [Bdellovibrio sp. SKB1291214]
MGQKIKVLIVDDSAVIRKLLEKIFSSAPDIEVVGTASDPYIARDKLVQLKPDVMTLDVEMPRMDGISFLEKVMQHFPTRTIIFSSLAKTGSETYLRALEAGAIEIMEKPSIDVSQTLEILGREIVEKVRVVARARIQVRTKVNTPSTPIAKADRTSLARTTHQMIAIASSTGGTEALKVFLSGMPANIPGTVVVQHMPPGFTKSFADNLNAMFPFEVKEAQEGDQVVPGRVLIAPGNFHMEITRSGAFYYVKLHQNPPMHSVRPAADYLMKSVAKYAGKNAMGVVLTGMGKDGAEGLLEMKNAGAYTIAQNEETCVVYGMPAAAVALGAADKVMALDKIAGELLKQLDIRDAA